MAGNLGEERKIASSRLLIGALMAMAGLSLAAVSVFSISMIVGLMAGPLIFLLGIVVTGHSLQRLVRIKKEESVKA